jgi:hypothetical protein
MHVIVMIYILYVWALHNNIQAYMYPSHTMAILPVQTEQMRMPDKCI